VLLATSHTVSGLTNGTAVTINVRAVNAAGNSTSVTETVTPITVPNPPQNFTATAGKIDTWVFVGLGMKSHPFHFCNNNTAQGRKTPMCGIIFATAGHL